MCKRTIKKRMKIARSWANIGQFCLLFLVIPSLLLGSVWCIYFWVAAGVLIRWSSSYCIAPYCVLLLRPLDANNLKSILHLLLLYYSIRFQFNQRNLLEKTTKNCCKKIERKAENTKRKIFLPQSFYFYFALLLLRCTFAKST